MGMVAPSLTARDGDGAERDGFEIGCCQSYDRVRMPMMRVRSPSPVHCHRELEARAPCSRIEEAGARPASPTRSLTRRGDAAAL